MPLLYLIILCIFFPNFSNATSLPFNTNVNMNVGIGTSTPQAGLVVYTGNVGIGTWSAVGGQLIVKAGNVGIGTIWPGTVLDVTGTTRTTGFQLNLNPTVSYVLQSNSVGVGTWVPSTTLAVTATASPAGTVPQLQYNSAGSMGGIANSGADSNGNIGIGTFNPKNVLAVAGGGVGIGTVSYSSFVTTAAPLGGLIIEGNVGIGTATPQAAFVVTRGNVGIGTWTAVGGQLIVKAGNVGIGTIFPSRLLEVMGNVGIGTTADRYTLKVNNAIVLNSVYDNGTAGASYTLNWNNGTKQEVTLTGSTTTTFTWTAPTAGVGNLLLIITNGGSSLITWPGTVKWPGGTDPTLTSTNGSIDIVSCFWDGATYYCTNSLNFQT